MKYRIEQISQGEDELILRYQRFTREVEQILNMVNFFLSNKSMIINIDKITQLSSLA